MEVKIAPHASLTLQLEIVITICKGMVASNKYNLFTVLMRRISTTLGVPRAWICSPAVLVVVTAATVLVCNRVRNYTAYASNWSSPSKKKTIANVVNIVHTGMLFGNRTI